MWKPRIPLHQYLDTDVSILNRYIEISIILYLDIELSMYRSQRVLPSIPWHPLRDDTGTTYSKFGNRNRIRALFVHRVRNRVELDYLSIPMNKQTHRIRHWYIDLMFRLSESFSNSMMTHTMPD